MCCFREIVQRKAQSAEALVFHSRHREFCRWVSESGQRQTPPIREGHVVLYRLSHCSEGFVTSSRPLEWEIHNSREIRYRLQKLWTLFNCACKKASVAERARLVVWAGSFKVVSLEPMSAVAIDEVMVHETFADTSTEKGVVTQATVDRLWVCTFVDSSVCGRDFLSVGRSLETLSATFMVLL